MQFHKAPISTTWGPGMMHATLQISPEETVDIYCTDTEIEAVKRLFTPNLPISRKQLEDAVFRATRYGDETEIYRSIVDSLALLMGVKE